MRHSGAFTGNRVVCASHDVMILDSTVLNFTSFALSMCTSQHLCVRHHIYTCMHLPRSPYIQPHSPTPFIHILCCVRVFPPLAPERRPTPVMSMTFATTLAWLSRNTRLHFACCNHVAIIKASPALHPAFKFSAVAKAHVGQWRAMYGHPKS